MRRFLKMRRSPFLPKATDRCRNCGDEFANHEYVKDSITKYKCKNPLQESTYGYFTGGDPKNFFPDPENCSPREIQNHKESCNFYNEYEERFGTPEPEICPSGFLVVEDESGNRSIAHVTRAPYGIGIQILEFEQFFQPLEHD